MNISFQLQFFFVLKGELVLQQGSTMHTEEHKIEDNQKRMG